MTFDEAWINLTQHNPHLWNENDKELAELFYGHGINHLARDLEQRSKSIVDGRVQAL